MEISCEKKKIEHKVDTAVSISGHWQRPKETKAKNRVWPSSSIRISRQQLIRHLKKKLSDWLRFIGVVTHVRSLEPKLEPLNLHYINDLWCLYTHFRLASDMYNWENNNKLTSISLPSSILINVHSRSDLINTSVQECDGFSLISSQCKRTWHWVGLRFRCNWFLPVVVCCEHRQSNRGAKRSCCCLVIRDSCYYFGW